MQHNREVAKDYIKKQKQVNPNYKVIDIGGAANPWCDELVNAYIDIIEVEGKKTFSGDIYSNELWEKIKKEKYDFCICTHMLEDIRDPAFIINKINENFSAGFISVPNKHTELSNIENPAFLGYCHHRWIFTIVEDKLKALAKMPVVEVFNQKNKKKCIRERILCMLNLNNDKFPKLDWVDKNIAKSECELAFIFKEHIDFEFINNDFAGINRDELINLYVYNLKEGL